MPRFIKKFLLLPLCMVAFAAPAHAFFSSGPTGPDPNLQKARDLGAEVKDRTGTIQNEIDKHVDSLLKYHQALQQLKPEQANALTEKDLARQMELHMQWAKKLEEMRDFLGEEYGLFIEKIKESEIKSPFKEEIIKHYDGTFRDAARQNLYPYLNGMENINRSLFETYQMISLMRFPPKSSNKKPETLNAQRLNLLKGAISEETLAKIKDHRRKFMEFIGDFQFNPIDDNPVLRHAMDFFTFNEKLKTELNATFIETYFEKGAFQAEANMRFFTSNNLNTEVPAALPKASGESLVNYAYTDSDIVKKLALGGSGDNTKACLIFAKADEFVGVDFNQILNNYFHQKSPWEVKGLFKAANDVVASSKAAPSDFSAGREQAAQLLELGKKSAAGEVAKSALYKKLTQKNKFSPRRYCFMRVALLQELLKLPSPAREDTLRLLYLEDLEKRMKNIPAAGGKK